MLSRSQSFWSLGWGPVGESAGEDSPLAHAARDPPLEVCAEGGCVSLPPSSPKPCRIPQTLLCPATLCTSRTAHERACFCQCRHPAQLESKPIRTEETQGSSGTPRPSPRDAFKPHEPLPSPCQPPVQNRTTRHRPWGQRSFPTRQDFLGFMPLCGASVSLLPGDRARGAEGTACLQSPPRTAGLPPVWAHVGETTDVRMQAPTGTSGISVPEPNRWVTWELHTSFFLSFYKNEAANSAPSEHVFPPCPDASPGPTLFPVTPAPVEDVPESFRWAFSLRPPAGTERTSFLFIPGGHFRR